MKNIKYMLSFMFLVSLFISSCDNEDRELGIVETPTNLQVTTEIIGQDEENPFGDGSGEVIFTATADNAVSYQYFYGNVSNNSPSGELKFSFNELGVNTYTIIAVANGQGGISSSTSFEVEVLSNFSPPSELLIKLSGSDDPAVESSKTWRIKKETLAHFGLGPVGGAIQAEWFGAGPDEKAGVGMYDDRYVFSSDGTFTHITNSTNGAAFNSDEDTVFGRVNLIDELGSHTIAPNGADIENYPLEDYTAQWSVTNPGGAVSISLSELGFIGYYTGGNHVYQIFDFNEDSPGSPANELILRTTDANNEFDWWFIITSEEEGATEEPSIDVEYTNLIWSDEFDADGAPDLNNWGYDIGTGSNGWGNNEEQYYTDRSDNVTVSDGTLKITAKRESFNGSEYTSTRMLSQDKFEFTYGRVDVRAKLPTGDGTWPAIWMLGANFSEVGWPATGEIDIMEHVGRNQDEVSSAIHTPSSSGNTINVGRTVVEGVSDDFHIFSVNWSAGQITFLVDNEIHYTYNPNNKTEDNWPFDKAQFLILNVAMGGILGGTIDTAFTESIMEIDYVRVYQ